MPLDGPIGTHWRNWTSDVWYQCLTSLAQTQQ
jgi:hypothetical protein